MTVRPLRLSIHALGGQGGAVLAAWIVDLAEAQGWIVQATSVPGVAQRTGATVYYLELVAGEDHQPSPVLALMPSPGDVDIVIAAELMEAGRAIARGLVTPDRTLLIASSHRIYAISEKSAMGGGIVSPAGVLDAARASAARLVLADFAEIAESHRSSLSAALFGALAASCALPFPREAFEAAIRRSGKSVETSVAAFGGGFDAIAAPAKLSLSPPGSSIPAGLPDSADALSRIGVDRLTDYQDRRYARLYLDRLGAVASADRETGGDSEHFRLTVAAARHLALWMSYEDVIRVADLKTRDSRFPAAGGGRIEHITEFLHPRFEELCDMLPTRLGEWLFASPKARRWFDRRLAKGRFITTTRIGGFLLLWSIGRLRRWRPRTLRFAAEQARIEAWLESAANAARVDYQLAVEIILLQRVVKGYGDTHARGLRNFRLIMGSLPQLIGRTDAVGRVRALHDAALADDEGHALASALEQTDREIGTATSHLAQPPLWSMQNNESSAGAHQSIEGRAQA